jgi:predicted metalloendopeptidase
VSLKFFHTNIALKIIVEKMSDEEMANFLCFRYILDRLPYLNANVRNLTVNFQDSILATTSFKLEKEEEKVEKRMSEKLPLAVDHLFYHKYFVGELREQMHTLVDEIQVRKF